jgi:phosphoglycerol transferase MdoB-like AlkP superfamily enzyme
MGFRVDMIVIFAGISLLSLVLLMPLRAIHNISFRTMLGVLWGLIIASTLFFNIADTLYFGFVNRHLSNELNVIGNDASILFAMAFDSFLLQSILSSSLFLLTVYGFYKIFSAHLQSKESHLKGWLVVPFVIIIAFLGIRNKLSGKSFSTVNAFAVNKVASGNLALNGVFCYIGSLSSQVTPHNGIDTQEAIKNVKTYLASPRLNYPDQNFPLMRNYKSHTQKNYNIVIIMVESLNAEYLNSLSNDKSGVMPNLDALAQEGMLFTNFYANGQRSLEGITTLYAGLVQPVGFKEFGLGLELYPTSFFPKILKNNGYTTLAMQSSKRGSYRVDQLSYLSGFETFYGAQDMPKTGQENGNPFFGVWDGDMLRFLSSKLHTIKEPFLSFAFTASTHDPYYSPGKRWEIFEHDVKSREGALNLFSYLDSEIGEFIERSKKEPWFDNTLFVFTADHSKRPIQTSSLMPGYHIPLILYAPKILSSRRVDFIGSHADIMPTIIDMLALDNNFTTIGQSLLDENVKERFAFVRNGDTVALAYKDSVVKYNFQNFLDSKGNSSKQAQKILLSVDTAQAQLLQNSNWIK